MKDNPSNEDEVKCINSIASVFIRYYDHTSLSTLKDDLASLFRKTGKSDYEYQCLMDAYGIVLERCLGTDKDRVMALSLKQTENFKSDILTVDQKVDALLSVTRKHPRLIPEANAAITYVANEILEKRIEVEAGKIHCINALRDYPDLAPGVNHYVMAHLDLGVKTKQKYFPQLVGALDDVYSRMVGVTHLRGYTSALKGYATAEFEAMDFHLLRDNKHVWSEMGFLLPAVAYFRGPDLSKTNIPDSRFISNYERRVAVDKTRSTVVIEFSRVTGGVASYKPEWVKAIPELMLPATYIAFRSVLNSLQGSNDNGLTTDNRQWLKLQADILTPVMQLDVDALKDALTRKNKPIPDVPQTAPLPQKTGLSTRQFLGP